MSLSVSPAGSTAIGGSRALPDTLSESWQLVPAEISTPLAPAEPVRMADMDDLAQTVSFEPGFVENAAEVPISPTAIDALFVTNGWLTQAAITLDPPAPSSSLGKTALAGAAASLGLAGLVAAIRARRRQATAS